MKRKTILHRRIYYFFNDIKLFFCKYFFYKHKEDKSIKQKIKNTLTILFVSFVLIVIVAFSILAINIKPIADDILAFINEDINIESIYEEQERAITIRDRNGVELTTIYPKYGGRHKSVKYEDIPPVLIKAVISAEDKNFFLGL